jgi:hypothetical protein
MALSVLLITPDDHVSRCDLEEWKIEEEDG